MKEEEKELLLKDLCARLSYGVMCQVDDGAPGLNDGKLIEIDISKELVRFDTDYYWDAYIDDVKPYLRPMSSMTEEEDKEYTNIDNRSYSCPKDYAHIPASDRIDWLNSRHFDYRGLIERGLAIEATNDIYKD